MPVVLMSRMQNASQVGLEVRANQRGTIHHAANLFESFTNLDVVDGSIDRLKGAHHLFDRGSDFKRVISLGIEGLRRRHPSCHPEQNAGIGRRLRVQHRFIT